MAEYTKSVQSPTAWQRTKLAISTGAALVGWIASGTGAVLRTVTDKLRDTVNVKDFGAVGDGVTDDTAAIQAALDTSARRIFFGEGTFMISAPLEPKTQQVLSGATRGTSIIKALAGFVGDAMLLYPSGTYSGVHIKDLLLNGDGNADWCIRLIGSAQGAVDQVALKNVRCALGAVGQIYLENVTYYVLRDVLANGGTDYAVHLKTCYTGAVKNSTFYHGGISALFVNQCSDNLFTRVTLFNNSGTTSDSLLLIENGHSNVFVRCTLEPQGAANVDAELKMRDTTAGNCVNHSFVHCDFIGLGNTKNRCAIIGDTGTIYGTLFQNCRFLKPSGANSILLSTQQETEFDGSRDIAAYDTANFAPVTVTNNSGNAYRYSNKLGTFGVLETESHLLFPAVQVPSSDANALDDYQEWLATPLDAFTITGSTGNPTNIAAVGGFQAQAIKIGRYFYLKHNFGAITWDAPGTGSFRINLPFSVNGMAKVQGTLFGTAVVGECNGTILSLYAVGSATALTWAAIGGSGSSLVIDLCGVTAA
jgi:hypothetical protein